MSNYNELSIYINIDIKDKKSQNSQ